MDDDAGRAGHGERALSAVLERLMDPDPRVRDLAADEAGDYFRGRVSSPAFTELAVAKLVAAAGAAIADGDEGVQESVLNACADAASFYVLPLAVFEPLVSLMGELSARLIGYMLQILGMTHDPAARSIIASYSSHPDRLVRQEAAEALVELAGRPSQGSSSS